MQIAPRSSGAPTHSGSVACLLIGALVALPASPAIVECRDARGVSILSPAGEHSACRQLPSSPRRAVDATPRATPASFPRVDAAVQRQRDNDRQQILQDELRAETARLAQLERRTQRPRAAPSAGESALPAPDTAEIDALLARTRENVRALQRELAGVR